MIAQRGRASDAQASDELGEQASGAQPAGRNVVERHNAVGPDPRGWSSHSGAHQQPVDGRCPCAFREIVGKPYLAVLCVEAPCCVEIADPSVDRGNVVFGEAEALLNWGQSAQAEEFGRGAAACHKVDDGGECNRNGVGGAKGKVADVDRHRQRAASKH